MTVLPLILAFSGALAADAERRVSFEPPPASICRKDSPATLHAGAATQDARFDRDSTPPGNMLADAWQGCGWRGERVNGCVAAWGCAEQLRALPAVLQGPDGAGLPVHTAFLRYTSAGGKLHADIVDETVERLDLPAGTTRPLWVWVDIPADAPAGHYSGTLELRAKGGLETSVPMELDVQAPVLPHLRNGASTWIFGSTRTPSPVGTMCALGRMNISPCSDLS